MTPRTEAATAAEHLPEITEVEEATQTINTKTWTAAITKIRSRRETKRGVTDTKTTETGDMEGMARTEAKRDFMNKDFCPGEEH